jgi:hypothetical protein
MGNVLSIVYYSSDYATLAGDDIYLLFQVANPDDYPILCMRSIIEIVLTIVYYSFVFATLFSK